MKNQRLANAKFLINKEHGSRTVDLAASVQRVPCISTGSIALDRGMGGGIPIGKATLFYGSESSGKTTTAYRIAGIAQKLCSNCFRMAQNLVVTGPGDDDISGYCDCYKEGIFKPVQYADEKDADFKKRISEYEENSYEEFRVALFDLEGAYDPPWAKKLGINENRLLYVRPDTAEEVTDIHETLLRTASVDLFIHDSLNAMVPATEVEDKANKAHQGLQARVLGVWNRKVTVAMNYVLSNYKKFPTHIWINQQREKIGVVYGDNTVIPGGKSQLFYSTMRVKFWPSKWQKSTLDGDLVEEFQSEVADKVMINFKIEKNRTSAPQYKSSFVMNLTGEEAGQVDEQKYLLAMAYKLGFMRDEGEGAKKKWYLGDQEYNTKKAALEKMAEPETYQELRRLILDRLLGK